MVAQFRVSYLRPRPEPGMGNCCCLCPTFFVVFRLARMASIWARMIERLLKTSIMFQTMLSPSFQLTKQRKLASSQASKLEPSINYLFVLCSDPSLDDCSLPESGINFSI